MPTTVAKIYLFGPEGNILLLTRSDSSFNRPSQPDLPGGHVDPGENFDSAVVREVLEETGIVLAETDVHLLFADTSFEHETNIIRLTYFATLLTTPQIQLSDEHSDYVWVDQDDARLAQIPEGYRRGLAYGFEHDLI